MRESLRSALALPVLLVSLSACRSGHPEDQVRKAFETCRAAVEAGDAAKAAEPLDPAFRGPDGMDKATARLYLLGVLRQEKIGVTVLRNEISVRGPEALQEVDLLLTGRAGGLLPQDVSQRSFHLRWRKSGREWKLMDIQSLDGR